jgi:membrane-associated phospholipid phosphatase
VAYPWLGILATFGRVRARTMLLELVYAAVMAFASVYLGHHYVLDGLLGIAYAFVAYALVRAVLREPEARASEIEETAGAR